MVVPGTQRPPPPLLLLAALLLLLALLLLAAPLPLLLTLLVAALPPLPPALLLLLAAASVLPPLPPLPPLADELPLVSLLVVAPRDPPAALVAESPPPPQPDASRNKDVGAARTRQRRGRIKLMAGRVSQECARGASDGPPTPGDPRFPSSAPRRGNAGESLSLSRRAAGDRQRPRALHPATVSRVGNGALSAEGRRLPVPASSPIDVLCFLANPRHHAA